MRMEYRYNCYCCLALSLLMCWFCFLDNSHGQIICPPGCHCLGLAVDCHGNNQTLARIVQDLPAVVQSFRFTVLEQSKYERAAIDLNTVQGLGKFKELRSFQIQSYSPAAPYSYNSLLRTNIFCKWTQLKEIHLNMHATYEDASVEPLFCLQRLKVLDLSYSRLIPDPVLQKKLLSTKLSRQITTLLLRNTQSIGAEETTEIYFARLFSKVNRSSLEVIDLSANAIRTCRLGLLLMPNLKKLDLSENMIFCWPTPSMSSVITRLTFYEAALHPSIEELSLSDPGTFIPSSPDQRTSLLDEFMRLLDNCSQISNLSQSGSEELIALCTTLRHLTRDIQNSSECVYGVQIPVGRHLQLVNISSITKYSYPYINLMPRGRYCLSPKNSLTAIDLSNMHAAQFIDNPTLSNISVTGLHMIKVFNLVNNELMLNNFQVFDNMSSLEQLLLGGNEVQIHIDKENELFKSLVNLINLDLSRNQLHTVPFTEFSHLSELQRLDLSGNKLQGVNVQLPSSSSLLMLNLSSNGMTFLRNSMADQFDKHPLLEVDLRSNSFICNCDALWFVRWVQTTPTRLTGRHFLECYMEEGLRTITKINLKELSKRCHRMSQLEVALTSASSPVGLILLIIGLIFVYRKRWRIWRYWYHRRLRKGRIALNDDYEYDAYVSYSDASRDVRSWVSGVMHEELEHRRGLRLFIHQRDLLGGGFFLERIDDAMRRCRKTVLVMSPEFLQSRTCLYEAWSAHTSMVTESRDAVVLVKLQPLPLAAITGTLANLMQIRDCLNWTEDPIGQNLFWEQLEDTILSVDNPVID